MKQATTETAIDLERLFKLRVAVARFGEMDLARWWNTKGQLGPLGTSALRRGFPRTHRFAQAGRSSRSRRTVAGSYSTPRLRDALAACPKPSRRSSTPAGSTGSTTRTAWEPFFAKIEHLRADDLAARFALSIS